MFLFFFFGGFLIDLSKPYLMKKKPNKPKTTPQQVKFLKWSLTTAEAEDNND